MSQKPTRNCHWVPETYLKSFAYDLKSTKIWRIEKPQQGVNLKKFELKPIGKVAVRQHLYVPRNANGTRDGSFEQRLANEIEPYFKDPVWKLLQTEIIDLSWEPLRMMVALLASTLYLRTPSELHKFSQMHHKMVEMLSAFEDKNTTITFGKYEQKIDWEEFKAYRNWDEDDIKRNWLSSISGAGSLAEDLVKMRWSVLKSETPSFITSDNPVTILHPSNEFRGLDNPLTSIRFPISPTHVLLFDHRHSEPANQYYPYPEPGGQNMLMWRNSLKHAFSHRHPEAVINEMVTEQEQFLKKPEMNS